MDATNQTLLTPEILDLYFPESTPSSTVLLARHMYQLVGVGTAYKYSFWDTLTTSYLGAPWLFDLDRDQQITVSRSYELLTRTWLSPETPGTTRSSPGGNARERRPGTQADQYELARAPAGLRRRSGKAAGARRGRLSPWCCRARSTNDRTGLLICSPLTTSIRGAITEVPVDNLEQPRVVAANLIHILDWRESKAKKAAHALRCRRGPGRAVAKKDIEYAHTDRSDRIRSLHARHWRSSSLSMPPVPGNLHAMDNPETSSAPLHTEGSPISASLLISSRCPHCQAVLTRMSTLVKQGAIGRLTVINLSTEPDAPEAAGVRSVPWTRIGPFELSGALSAQELHEWAEAAAGGGGWGRYYAHLIETRRLPTVIDCIRDRPHTLQDLIRLFADPETSLSVRIGISAIMEGLAGSETLTDAVPELVQLTLSPSHQVRADACYFIGLAGDPTALPSVERLLDDEQADVREVAMEVSVLLQGTLRS